MADLCCVYTVSSVTINAATGDTLLTDFDGGEITGLDGAPIRSQVDPQGQSDGGIVHQKFFGARIISFSGALLIRTIPDRSTTAYVSAVNVLEAATVSALQAILNTPTTLAWTPTGGSAHSISVTYGTEGGEIEFSGNMIDRRFHFSLIAANPTIS